MLSQQENIDYKSLYLAEQQDHEVLKKSHDALETKVMQLQYQLQQLAKFLNGFKSERFVPASSAGNAQKELGLEFDTIIAPTEIIKEEVIVTKKKTQSAANSDAAQSRIPDNVRREITVIEPQEDISGYEKIGELVTETLSWHPGEVFVKRTVRPQYRKIEENGKEKIIVAPLPERAIAKCMAEPELLAQVTIDKFIDHKPLNRQLDCFGRSDIRIPYSTIADWIKSIGVKLHPFAPVLLQEMFKHKYWRADETGIKVLDKKIKRDTYQGYFWSYMTGDGRLIYYDYQPGRGGEYPLKILKNFKGHLQTDGYNIYDDLGIKEIIVFFCMAHARRKIFDSLGNDKARGEYALTEIKKLYAIEEACREQQLNEEEIKLKRQQEALPILKSLGEWMKKEYEQMRPSTVMAKAFAYSIKRWEKLSLYATTGHLGIDNNPIERSMKSIAVGRKNYMFCGSHEAAKRAGLIYSLLVTCKLNNVNPYEWLKDILSRNIDEMPINKLKELLPHNWKLNQGDTTA